MTISTTVRRAGPFACNGVATSFPFAFKINNASDLLVVTTDAAGNDTTRILTTDYLVTLNSDQNASPGGTVTTNIAYAAGVTLSLGSVVPLTQLTDITNTGGFYPKVVTEALDRIVMQVQQIAETTSRAILAPFSGGVLGQLPATAARVGRFLGFDASGNVTALSGTGADAALRTDLAASTGSTLIGWLQAGIGAVLRPIRDKLLDEVSITDFGVFPSNSAAVNTANFNAAIAAAQAGTFSSICVPPGNYALNQVNDIPKNILIYGRGFNSQLTFTVLPVAAGSFITIGGSPGRQYSIASAGTTDWGACGAQLVNATQFGLQITAGKQYVIKTVGTTNWIALGAASNTAGVIFMSNGVVGAGTGVAWERSFTATAVGSGTGTAQPDAMRFTGNVMGSGLQNLSIITTNGAASVVAIEGGFGTNGNGGSERNFFISRVNFGGSVCAYAIDHRNDYGIAIEHCLINGITGSGVRLRDNSATPNYSYSSKIRGCDFTATSGVQIEAENGGSQGPISIVDCVIENGISGVLCNTGPTGGGFSWNVSLDNTYIEQMSGLCVSINRNGAASYINSHLLLKSCYIQGTIDLGDVGQLTAISCTNQGAANAPLCTITGSSFAAATFIECNGFTQSGTFAWLPQGVPLTWTPVIGGVAASSVSGLYSISGRTVTAQLRFTVTAAPTGNIAVPLPVPFIAGSALATFYNGNALVGSANARVAGATFYTGSAFYNQAVPAILFEGPNTANFWQAGVPGVWANGDYINIALSYQI